MPLNFISFCWRHCTDALLRWPSVQLVMKTWLLYTWHRLWTIVWSLHRCLFMPRRFNRCYWVFLTWLSIARPISPMLKRRFIRDPSVRPMPLRRFNRCNYFCCTCPTCCGDLFNTSKIFSLDFYYATVDWAWRLNGDLDMVPWRWFGLFASTVDWIWRLYGELDIFDFIHGI